MENSPPDAYAHYYDEIYQRAYGNMYDQFTFGQVKAIEGILPVNSRILEIGAGTGRLAIPLAEAGYKVTAVESSKGMVEVLLKKVQDRDLNINVVNDRIQDFSAVARSYDLAICLFTVINYLKTEDHVVNMFDNCFALLEKGSKFVVDFSDNILLFNHTPRINQPNFTRRVSVEHRAKNIYDYVESVTIDNHSFEIEIELREWHEAEILNIAKNAGFVCDHIPGLTTPNHILLAFTKRIA